MSLGKTGHTDAETALVGMQPLVVEFADIAYRFVSEVY